MGESNPEQMPQDPRTKTVPKSIRNLGPSPDIYKPIPLNTSPDEARDLLAKAADGIMLNNIWDKLPKKLQEDNKVRAQYDHRNNVLNKPK